MLYNWGKNGGKNGNWGENYNSNNSYKLKKKSQKIIKRSRKFAEDD